MCVISLIKTIQSNYFAGAFHDALILYANAVNQTLAENGSIRDGAALVRKMWNSTFQGNFYFVIIFLS